MGNLLKKQNNKTKANIITVEQFNKYDNTALQNKIDHFNYETDSINIIEGFEYDELNTSTTDKDDNYILNISKYGLRFYNRNDSSPIMAVALEDISEWVVDQSEYEFPVIIFSLTDDQHVIIKPSCIKNCTAIIDKITLITHMVANMQKRHSHKKLLRC